MSAERPDRIQQLLARGEAERQDLAAEIALLRREVDGKREKLRYAGAALTTIATVVTVLYKFFGRGALAVRVGRIASAAGVLFQLSRAAFRTSARFTGAQLKRLRANRAAWRFFVAQPPGYRRVATHWVMSAKREETRARRLETLIADSASGLRIGPLRRS